MDPTQIPLRDLHLPAEIGWWPLAPGWWVLLGLLAIGAAVLIYRAFLRWRANRARRIALRQLTALAAEYETSGDATRLAKHLSELLRRVVLAYSPRAEVAGLTGDAWLRWLDRGLAEPLFEKGGGRSLEALPYRTPVSGSDAVAAEVDALIAAVRTRLQTPLAEGAG